MFLTADTLYYKYGAPRIPTHPTLQKKHFCRQSLDYTDVTCIALSGIASEGIKMIGDGMQLTPHCKMG